MEEKKHPAPNADINSRDTIAMTPNDANCRNFCPSL